MAVLLEPLLQPDAVAKILMALLAEQAPWQSGSVTAGWHARTVKNNRQLDLRSDLHGQLQSVVFEALRGNRLVQAMAFPRRIHSMRFSRCGVGEGYGSHIDNALMADGRTDLSFTVALSDPDSYSGGDLVLELTDEEERFRLPAGHAVLYPSTLLHRVEPVKSGERLVAVGWIESRIRRADQRQLLFDLDMASRLQFSKQGKDEVFDLVSRCYANLVRLWDS